ncbi:MBL fold metallo-hydrolase [Paenibacillus sinopodophylli]|uniref:MBL fold metallo-hydrolase n=1 Tax=Paenibacillus sinopodophylli TaxID=1837342 RepID=UPI00110C9948|nr:MBL fold metallo-hydrolase [Paenibacillus sinopodophylli]
MIKITPIGSSSAGNAYHITDGETALLLEAGLSFKIIQRSLNYRTSELAACLLTHNHGDHVKGANEVMKAGIDVYCSAGTAEAAGLSGHRVNAVESMNKFTIGTWTILPFDVQHDAAEPLGFLLANQAGDKLLFATDTYYIKYKFLGLTHLLIECNYSESIVEQNILSQTDEDKRSNLIYRRSRLIKSHFSLENMKEFIRSNDMSQVLEIWLIHLSDTNSDEALFKREIQELTGRPVYVAGR